jgi:hypothetical protein
MGCASLIRATRRNNASSTVALYRSMLGHGSIPRPAMAPLLLALGRTKQLRSLPVQQPVLLGQTQSVAENG